jgi:hypothetical protein
MYSGVRVSKTSIRLRVLMIARANRTRFSAMANIANIALFIVTPVYVRISPTLADATSLPHANSGNSTPL